MFRLDFKDKDGMGVLLVTAEERYGICIQALRAVQKAPAFDQWDDMISLLKKLKALGRVTNQEAPKHLQQYELKEPGSIYLERGERALLLDYIRQGQWIPDALETARATLKWLEAIEDDPTPKNEPTPLKKR